MEDREVKNENEILLPVFQDVKVGSKTYRVGKLGVDQQIMISRFILRTVLTNQSKLKTLKESTQGNSSNAEDLIRMFDLIDKKDIYELFSIILNEKDPEYLKGEGVLDLGNETEIIAIFIEQNENLFKLVKKNVMRIIKALKR